MFHQNLKILRHKKQLSQQLLAEALGIPRTTYSEYEKGNTEPNLKLLKRMSELFKISLDQLLTGDISLDNLEIFNNKELRILAMTMDSNGQNNIELVSTRAEAGYVSGMSDPEYISDLPKISFPSLQNGRYRAFEINGDSMLPLESGSIIISSYVEKLENIKNDTTYIVITHKDGVVYKRLHNLKDENRVLAISDNERFKPYTIDYTDIQELWKYHAHIGFSDVKKTYDHMIEDKINDMHHKISELYDRKINHS